MHPGTARLGKGGRRDCTSGWSWVAQKKNSISNFRRSVTTGSFENEPERFVTLLVWNTRLKCSSRWFSLRLRKCHNHHNSQLRLESATIAAGGTNSNPGIMIGLLHLPQGGRLAGRSLGKHLIRTGKRLQTLLVQKNPNQIPVQFPS